MKKCLPSSLLLCAISLTLNQYAERLFMRYCILFFAVFVFLSCKKATHPQLAFYRWRVANNYALGQREDSVLTHFNTKELYVKVMDIDWDDVYGASPITTFPIERLNDSEEMIQHALNITPVIFITNKAIDKTDSSEIDELARKIVLKTKQLVQEKKVVSNFTEKIIEDTTVKYNEIQIDCDWTASTQKKYFRLLSMIKQLEPNKLISSTLRLHQYKYPGKTGVPPVDEVYLMCYNTGDLKKLNEKNSIFDYATAKEYFDGTAEYPKKINIALPAFDWTVIFKNDHFYKIDNNLGTGFFSDTMNIQQLANNRYMIKNDTVVNDNFLRKGDILKWEKISEEDMLHAAQLCSRAVNSTNFKIVFYDIDKIQQENYDAVQKAVSYFMR